MKKLNLVTAIVGLAIFAGVAAKEGPMILGMELKHLWLGIGVVILLSFARLLLQSCSWSTALKATGRSPSIGQLMGTRMAAQSLGYLSTLGPLFSEPFKIRLLGTSSRSAVSTLIDTGVFWFTSSVLGLIGCTAAVLLLAKTRHFVWVVPLAVLFLSGLVLFIRQKSLLTHAVQLCGRRCPAWLRKGEHIETQVRDFRLEHPAAVRNMAWIDAGCQVLMAGEVAAMLWAVNAPLHMLTILAIEVCTRAVKLAAGWVPARIGADESGAIAAFAVFGLSPASGFTLAIARRTRDLLWCAVGLTWLGWQTRRSAMEKSDPIQEEVLCRL
jgi:hypothetical protein